MGQEKELCLKQVIGIGESWVGRFSAARAGETLLSFLLLLFLGGSVAAAQAGEPTNAQEATRQQQKLPAITPQMQAAEMARRARMTPDELAWEKTLEANLGNYYLPIYYADKDAGRETAWDYVQDDPHLPRLLILGDSISRGYTLAVRHALAGKVNVHRAPANCGPTATGLKKLDVWLGTGKWDVITWNFGIHDRATDPKVYAENLEALLARLRKTGAKIVWVRSTPAPPSGVSQEGYSAAECDRINGIADEVMRREGIPEVDLYSLMLPHLQELQLPDSVHFKEAGYQRMGDAVAAEVLTGLGGNGR